MRFSNEVYEPVSQEDWDRTGGPATLDEVASEWRDEFARRRGRQPADIGEYRLWFDGLTADEIADSCCRVFNLVRADKAPTEPTTKGERQ